jgi:sodium/potassium-transporting ATPase subunit alpha
VPWQCRSSSYDGFDFRAEAEVRVHRSFWFLERNGVPFSSLALKFGNYPAALTNDLLYEAQSVYFFTLVVMQWGCAILHFFVM